MTIPSELDDSPVHVYAPEIDPDERTIEAEPQGGHWIAGLVALVLIAIGTAGLVLIAIRIWRIML